MCAPAGGQEKAPSLTPSQSRDGARVKNNSFLVAVNAAVMATSGAYLPSAAFFAPTPAR
jgi:hypothetical protein